VSCSDDKIPARSIIIFRESSAGMLDAKLKLGACSGFTAKTVKYGSLGVTISKSDNICSIQTQHAQVTLLARA